MGVPPPSGPVDPDKLPEDLKPGYVGPYQFPDTARRRIAAAVYLVAAAGAITLYVAKRGSASVNAGFLVAGIVLVLIAAWHILASWHLAIDEVDALARAGASVGFPVGHAAASLAWRGLSSRPVWRILLYSAEDPPLQRGIVEVDGVDGAILLSYAEDNPEDWSEMG